MEITIKTAVLSAIVEKLVDMEKELQFFEGNTFKFSTKELRSETETILQKINNSEFSVVHTRNLGKLGKIGIGADICRVDISDEAIRDFMDIAGKMVPHIMHVTMTYVMACKQAEFYATGFKKKYHLANQQEETPKD